MDKLSTVQKTLLSLVSASLFNTPATIPENIDFCELWKEANAQAVSCLAFNGLDLDTLSPDLADEIRRMLKARIQKNIRVLSQHANIHNILTEKEIPYTIIKGLASGLYYPDPLLRSYGDVDFLVDEKDFNSASAALSENGIVKENRNHLIHDIFTGNGIRFEMHLEPAGIPYEKAGEIIRDALKSTIESSQIQLTEFGEIRVPDNYHHGIIILLHTAHHLTGEGIGLRQLCDWACFINSFDEVDFITHYRNLFTETGLWEFCKVITKICTEFLGCKEFSFTENVDSKLTDALIVDIFKGGNFGQKDINRTHEAMLISQHGKNGVGNTSKLGQFITSANNIVFNKWPSANKNKLLLPFGWLIFGTRYLIRSKKGTRPAININETITNADKRIDIYRQLHLFETEVK